MPELTREQQEALKVVDSMRAIQEVFMRVRAREIVHSKIAPAYRERKLRRMYQVKLPKEGGILTYYENYPYPSKGFPIAEAVEKIDVVKKNIIGLLSGFKTMFIQNKIKTLIFFLLFRKQLNQGFSALLEAQYNQLKSYFLQPDRYCDCVREVNRVFDSLEFRQGRSGKGIERFIKKIVSVILEYDDAYRYRFQNIVGGLDKNAFEKNPMKELIRLVNLGETRENSPKVIGTWRMIKLLLSLAQFHPIRKNIILFFQNLNIKEVKLSVEDSYYAKEKTDYKW